MSVRTARASIAAGFILLALGSWGTYSLLFEDSPAVLRAKVVANDIAERVVGSRPFDEQSFYDDPALGEVDTASPAPDARLRPLFELSIPKLKRRYVVYEGTSPRVLAKGPGHIAGTAYPWFRGNTGISGHRVTHGAPFRHLDLLRPGDSLVVEYGATRKVFRVLWTRRVKPTDTSVLRTTTETALTLTTCDPPFSARYRLVVRAVAAEGSAGGEEAGSENK